MRYWHLGHCPKLYLPMSFSSIEIRTFLTDLIPSRQLPQSPSNSKYIAYCRVRTLLLRALDVVLRSLTLSTLISINGSVGVWVKAFGRVLRLSHSSGGCKEAGSVEDTPDERGCCS